MANLDGSHGDIILVILDILRNIKRPRRLFLKDLRSLSLTTRSLRTICLPILFRTLKQVWGVGLYKQAVPNSLCSYVLIFELDMAAVDLYSLEGIGPPEELTVILPKILPQMKSLHTFKLTNALFLGVWPSLLRSVFGLPHIHTLEIRDSVWRVPEERFTNDDLTVLAADDDISHRVHSMPEIRKFIYRAPFTDCFPMGSKSYGRRDTIQGTVEVSNLVVLIELFRPSLEVLELPGELAPRVMHEVAAKSFSGSESKPLFPNLREFCAQGHIPLTGSGHSSSQHRSNSIRYLEGFFGRDSLEWCSSHSSVWAPRLRQLKLCLAAPSDHSQGFNNGNAKEASDLEQQGQYLYGGPTELRFLALSTPVSDRAVFRYLPENLTELDLRAYPLPGVLGRSSDKSVSIHTTVPSARELAVVFGNLGGMRSRLRILKISYTAGDADASDDSKGDGEFEERIFVCLMKTFSGVEVLEVHRFESVARTRAQTETDETDGWDEAIPQALTRHLSNSRHLKDLSLNLDNSSLHHPTLHRSRISWAHVDTEQRRIDREIRVAKTIAEKIKSLSTIRTMSHEGFSSHWNIWEVVRKDTVGAQTLWSSSDNSEPIVELLNRGRCEV